MNTPASTQVGHGKHLQEKTIEYALPIEDDMEGNAPQNPNLSVKTFAPATTWVSHVENYQQSTVKFTLPAEDDTKGNATQSQDPSLKLLSATPATTQNQDLSLRTLFATQSTTRVSHVKEHEQSTVRFDLPNEDDMEHNAPENPDSSHKVFPKTPATTHRFVLPDEGNKKQGTATQNQGHGEDKKSETFRDMNFQDFVHKYFDDEVDYYPGDNSSKDKMDEIKQHDLPSEVAGTSHHDASGLKDSPIFLSIVLVDNMQGTTTDLQHRGGEIHYRCLIAHSVIDPTDLTPFFESSPGTPVIYPTV
ncbi:unnamed protein product [Lactuca virosa]|uniref:Uncharacterized protein n=1 Tax=Lactuca virosa TaxID=75947 RepID=A0AAU9NYX8_9ASTR|nr:unnamed protein product [Lactuca virosa]